MGADGSQITEVEHRPEARFLFSAPARRPGPSHPERCAGAVMEIGLLVTRLVRREVRRSRPAGLSLQHFRALAGVAEGSAGAPSALALHLGVAPATVTKLVDDLVRKGFLRRSTGTVDRRSRVLLVTAAGRRRLREAFVAFRAEFARRVESLPPRQRTRITEAAERLRPLLQGDFPDR
jgi:DNA-binding MarR family transcriptional regulator